MKRVFMIVTYILSGVGFLAVLYVFFNMLSEGFVAALVNLVVGLALLVPIVAVAVLLGCVDELETKVDYLENELIRKDVRENPPIANGVQEAKKGRNAITSWTCAKCGTVNKANTANCENCGSAY